MQSQKLIAEAIGTFWLVFGGLRQRRAGGGIPATSASGSSASRSPSASRS